MRTITNLLKEEVKTVGNSELVFIGGFAEGRCLALATFLKFQGTLGGIFGSNGGLFSKISFGNLDLKKSTPI